MDITGVLKMKGDLMQVSEKFKKRDFVLTDNSSQYPQHISFQLVQDKCGLIDQYNIGDEVKIYFNLRGREWKSPQGDTKYFNTLEAWRLEAVSASGGGASQANKMEAVPEAFSASAADDDLPF
jgi:hypothetical protein